MTDLFQRGSRVYCVGIKGSGVSALVELLHHAGVHVSGSDTADVFYTDAILTEMGIPYFETFDPSHLSAGFDVLIHSAAYTPETNPELFEARRRGLPILSYAEALGAYSARFDSSGIAGTHGKTTTTAMTGALLQGASLPAQVLAGSASFGGRSTLTIGNKYFVAETCEYRRHFLSFHPRRIVLTSVESDHQDYYPTYESIRDAFVEYGRKLPSGGELIFCADDAGACEVVEILRKELEKPLTFTPYGFSADGAFRLTDCRISEGRLLFSLAGFSAPFALRVSGTHSALDAAAGIALASSLMNAEYGGWDEARLATARLALSDFRGSKRRCEIIGEAGGVLFMDDYGHHPTAIKTTLAGLKAFYPGRRLIVSFMSHTYTRTAALLDDFAGAFADADLVVLHKIYASARETISAAGAVSGETLYEKTKEARGARNTWYEEEPLAAVATLAALLQPGDLFITMGAGDNWKLGKALLHAE